MNNEKTEELRQLIWENPTLPIAPIVYYDDSNEEYCSILGSFRDCSVGEYALLDDGYFTERAELAEQYCSKYADFFEGLSEIEIVERLEKKTGHLWIKAIIVYIALA